MKRRKLFLMTMTILSSMLVQEMTGITLVEAKADVKLQEQYDDESSRQGLYGFYFEDEYFSNPTINAPTEKNMAFSLDGNEGLISNNQTFQSVRWLGYIVSNDTKEVKLKLTNIDNYSIEINGELNPGSVQLKKGEPIVVKIEMTSPKKLKINDLEKMKLISVDLDGKESIIDNSQTRNPNFNDKDWGKRISESTKKSLLKISKKSIKAIKEDTDGDTIYDDWEINGYTIQNRKAVEWKDEFVEQGYTKFVSNPLEAHTVGDPYNDYEKAARDLPLANAKETYNPLVAAYPIINVNLEKTVLSLNKDMSNSVGSNSSTNWSYTNTEGATVNAGFGQGGFSFGVSANYSHSETVAEQWGHSTEDTSSFNTATAAFLNANVRYNNVGTGAIYNVKPTTGFVLDGTTIGTITAKSNTTALSISPGECYPKDGQNGIAINTLDDFNSQPISLNNDQVKKYLNNNPIRLETDQTDGTYMIKDINGGIREGGQWNGIMQEIKEKTASIIIDTGDSVAERRVAARDYDYPEDKTPSLTLKEALKIAYLDVVEKDGLLYYNDIPIYEANVMTYVDHETEKEIEKQIKDTTGKFKDVNTLYDVKLTPKMNFTIKLPILFDKENVNIPENRFANWYGVYVDSNGGHTGTHQYRSSGNFYGLLHDDSIEKLDKNSSYYVSMYMKADSDIEPTIEIYSKDKLLQSKQVEINNTYKRVDILVEAINEEKIDRIKIRDDSNVNIYWDDVSISKISSTIQNTLSDDKIRAIYSNYTKITDSNNDYNIEYLNGVTFHDIRPVDTYIKSYRLVAKTKDSGSIDKTFPSPQVKDGEVTINFLDYNQGKGFELYTGDSVTLYAIGNDGREIEVLSISGELDHEEINSKKIIDAHKFSSWNYVVENKINGLFFRSMDHDIYNLITKYKVSIDGKSVTHDKYKLENDGRLYINFVEYNNGYGVNKSQKIDIWAVTEYGKEYKVLSGNAGDSDKYTDDEIKKIYSNYEFYKNGLNRRDITFYDIQKYLGSDVKSYRVKYNTPNTSIQGNFDKSRPSYNYNSDGSIRINFTEYNNGYGIRRLQGVSDELQIYVQLNNGREILVQHFKNGNW